MFEVVGYQHKELHFPDGNSCSGYYLFLTEERKGVTGIATERIFCSDSKIDFAPELGDEVEVNYNRFGKVASVGKC